MALQQNYASFNSRHVLIVDYRVARWCEGRGYTIVNTVRPTIMLLGLAPTESRCACSIAVGAGGRSENRGDFGDRV
jgi:hypothetical protein